MSQTISQIGNVISLSGDGTVDVSQMPIIQELLASVPGNAGLFLSGNVLTIGTVGGEDLSNMAIIKTLIAEVATLNAEVAALKGGGGSQTLALAGNDLAISGGNTVDLSTIPAIQTLDAEVASLLPPPPPTVPPWPTGQTWPVTCGPGQYFTEPGLAVKSAIAAGALVKGFSIKVLAGTYVVPFDIPQGMDGWTITGAGPDAYATVCDGQGGETNNHPLAFHKGFIHAQSPGTVKWLQFKNCGGLPFSSSFENQAGVFAETFAALGTITVVQCAFDGCNDSVYVPGIGAGGDGVSIVVDHCDFGLHASNGADQSGNTHDMYVQGAGVVVRNSHFYGNAWGHQIKSRAQSTEVDGCYVAQLGGRWVECPDGGALSMTGNTFVTLPATLGGNVFGYGNESVKNGSQNFAVAGCSLSIVRNVVWWVQPPVTCTFDAACAFGAFDPAHDLLSNPGSGTLAGLQPFKVIGTLPAAPPTATTG